MTKMIGLILLMGCLLVVYLFDTNASASGVFRVFHWPAMILTGLGPVGMILLCSEWQRIAFTFKKIFNTTPSRMQAKVDRESRMLLDLGKSFYESGPKAFGNVGEIAHLSPVLVKTLDRLRIKVPASDVRDLLERERDQKEMQLNQATQILSLGVRLAPSVGMLGTILGMVQLLSSLKDPSQIGSHMSLALLTTFYGLFFSLVLWTPLSQKMESLKEIELSLYDRLLYWVELLENRKPTQYLSPEGVSESGSRRGSPSQSSRMDA